MTIDILNFLVHFVIGESPEERFYEQQLYNNMRNSFKEKYLPDQL